MKSTLVSSEVASPYAEALMSLADAGSLVDQLGAEVRELAALLEGSPELQALAANPVLAADKKKAVLQAITADAHPYLRNFLMLLADKRRIVFLPEICDAFLALVRKRKNIELAEVTSTVELTEEQQATVKEKVKALTGASEVELKTAIDPSLIGGLIVKVGSQILDASLRGQLRRVSLNLGVA
ncbi:MAG: ATP synthase F1 subunit delta [Cyanobacteria bacterium J06641_5]